jgi:NADH:ubiquinone oxidoreductase subunit 6 (subunit J)
VTFLFVLMLAQPEGHAYYDRISWEGMLAATTCALLVGFLTMTIVRVLNPYVDPQFLAALESFRPEETGGLAREHIRSARLVANPDQTWTMDVAMNDDAPILSARDQDRLESHLLRRMPSLESNQVSAADFELVVSATLDPLLANVTHDRDAGSGVLAPEHVATLGGELFSRHLIAIEVAGTLLLVALVGAIAIVGHDRSRRKHPAREADNSRPLGGN